MSEGSSNERLRKCFREVGAEYHAGEVNAEFMSFKDIKVRWQRAPKWFDFKVTDYLQDAPDQVLTGLAESLFRRIFGIEEDYSTELYDWVTRPEFSMTKKTVYLQRSKNLDCNVEGDSKNLRDSYDRLVGAGLVPYDPAITLAWMDNAGSSKAGKCSVLMKVVAISKSLDRDNVPDLVIDYCLYHELCHILAGYDPLHEGAADRFIGLDDRFSEKYEAEQWLRRLSVHV